MESATLSHRGRHGEAVRSYLEWKAREIALADADVALADVAGDEGERRYHLARAARQRADVWRGLKAMSR